MAVLLLGRKRNTEFCDPEDSHTVNIISVHCVCVCLYVIMFKQTFMLVIYFQLIRTFKCSSCPSSSEFLHHNQEETENVHAPTNPQTIFNIWNLFWILMYINPVHIWNTFIAVM